MERSVNGPPPAGLPITAEWADYNTVSTLRPPFESSVPAIGVSAAS
jgi:hypothetical protein